MRPRLALTVGCTAAVVVTATSGNNMSAFATAALTAGSRRLPSAFALMPAFASRAAALTTTTAEARGLSSSSRICRPVSSMSSSSWGPAGSATTPAAAWTTSSSALSMAKRSMATRGGGKQKKQPSAASKSNVVTKSPPPQQEEEQQSESEQPEEQQPQQKKKKKKPKKTFDATSNTGGLRRLPVVKPPTELISTARRVAYNVQADVTIKNARNRARKHGAETLQATQKALCVPLRECIAGYKRELRGLHPFERVVADLTARAREKQDGLTLLDVLDELNEARKELLLAGKDWTAKAKTAETSREADLFAKDGEAALYSLFTELAAPPLTGILQLQKSLRTTPAVRLDTPAVVLVGAPNVGKSSIVRAISSGTPEVNNYPFTTRGMTLGHVEVFWENEDTAAAAVIPLTDNDYEKGDKRPSNFVKSVEMERVVGRYAFSQLCQIMDSPGLLVRPDAERNEMESLTLAAMSHLPTAVMYVMDLSGGAGDKCSSVADQMQLRREVRERFPRRPWIDVVSKADLALVDGAREELEEILGDTPYLEVSVTENTGVDELRGEVMRMLEEVRVVLDAMAVVDARTARSSK